MGERSASARYGNNESQSPDLLSSGVRERGQLHVPLLRPGDADADGHQRRHLQLRQRTRSSGWSQIELV